MTDQLQVKSASIEGLLAIDLVVNRDERGWFKENYQEQKLREQGFPEFRAVQNNYSHNADVGVTRGIHAEPWNKYISLASGRVYSAIVDLRPGPGFGRMEAFELSPATALYVPAGCGNSFQTLAPDTVYTYLVDAHWFPEATYTMVNLWDEELAIEWPIGREMAIFSEKDQKHPPLAAVRSSLG